MAGYILKSLGGPRSSFCLLLSEKCISFITTWNLSEVKSLKKKRVSSSQFFEEYDLSCRLLYNAHKLKRTKTTYISSIVTFSHFLLILKRNVKRETLLEISCWAYLLFSSTMSCTRAISKMFSNALNIQFSIVDLMIIHMKKCFSWSGKGTTHTYLMPLPILYLCFPSSSSPQPLSVHH